MKVSIITSCYNREATIRGAIESVLEQDYPYIEYIVVDLSLIHISEPTRRS